MLPLNPIKYIRFINRVVRYSRQVKHKTNLNLLKQGSEVYKLLRLNMLEPREYYETYGLFDPGFTWDEKKRFLSRHQFAILNYELNPRDTVGVLNKLVFKIYAQHFNLAVPKMYGLFDPNFGYTVEGDNLRTPDDLEHFIARQELQSFMFKPISADKASGIIACSKQNGRLILLGEGEIDAATLHQRMRNSHHSGFQHVNDSWLVEERIRQHPWFDRFSASFVHNYRIVTFLTSKGAVELIGAGIGIGLTGQFILQTGSFSLSAGISDDGVLTTAVRSGPNGIELFETHPETGVRIAGERPPWFRDAVELACRAHSFIPQLRLVGWDIAPAENGPVIFEGNRTWNWEKLQRCNRCGVIRGSLAQELPGIIGAK